MFKKNLPALVALFGAIFIINLTAIAQETESAPNSAITEASLPAGALRILPASVPSEIDQGLKKIVAAGDGKIVQGDSEVLAWTGANYKKGSAANLMQQVQSNLLAKGWTYEVGERNDDITVFSVLRDTPKRQGILGFFAATDDAMILAWTEILPAGAKRAIENNFETEKIAQSPTHRRGGSGEIVGTWTNGGMSLLLERNTVTGATTPLNGSTFKYVFTAGGNFEAIGLIQSTVYGCTTSLFNDKRGKYEINGSQITLVPNKNFWRNTYSCSPQSNKERDYVLERETIEWRTKTDEYGKSYICLANAKGESCYRRAQ